MRKPQGRRYAQKVFQVERAISGILAAIEGGEFCQPCDAPNSRELLVYAHYVPAGFAPIAALLRYCGCATLGFVQHS